jgi:hypothetical protein
VARAQKRKTVPKKKRGAAPTMMGPREDYGRPIDGVIAKAPVELRKVLVELRGMIEKEAPDAESALKWGMPFFSLGGRMFTALGVHKSHVNLILAGPPGTYADPEGRLEGEGKTGKHLKLRTASEIPRSAVRGWLRTAAKLARGR